MKVVILERNQKIYIINIFIFFVLFSVEGCGSMCTHIRYNAISFEYQWNMKGERKDADINPVVLKKGWKLYI